MLAKALTFVESEDGYSSYFAMDDRSADHRSLLINRQEGQDLLLAGNKASRRSDLCLFYFQQLATGYLGQNIHFNVILQLWIAICGHAVDQKQHGREHSFESWMQPNQCGLEV